MKNNDSQIQKLINCLEIAKTYSGDVAADHDVIHFGGPDPDSEVPIQKEDAKELKVNGAHYDKSIDSWSKFV